MIAVRDISNYFFCPYAFYLEKIGYTKTGDLWRKMGKEKEEIAKEYLKKKYKNVNFDIFIEGKEFVGKLDATVNNIPIEIKYSNKVKKEHILTLQAYALLLEEKIKKPIRKGILVLVKEDKVKEEIIRLNETTRKAVENAIKECNEILNGKIPKRYISERCKNCDYRKFCFNL